MTAFPSLTSPSCPSSLPVVLVDGDDAAAIEVEEEEGDEEEEEKEEEEEEPGCGIWRTWLGVMTDDGGSRSVSSTSKG